MSREAKYEDLGLMSREAKYEDLWTGRLGQTYSICKDTHEVLYYVCLTMSGKGFIQRVRLKEGANGNRLPSNAKRVLGLFLSCQRAS